MEPDKAHTKSTPWSVRRKSVYKNQRLILHDKYSVLPVPVGGLGHSNSEVMRVERPFFSTKSNTAHYLLVLTCSKLY